MIRRRKKKIKTKLNFRFIDLRFIELRFYDFALLYMEHKKERT
jgi:hypothetical protein